MLAIRPPKRNGAIVGPTARTGELFITGLSKFFSTMFSLKRPRKAWTRRLHQSERCYEVWYLKWDACVNAVSEWGIGHATGNDADVTVSELAAEVVL